MATSFLINRGGGQDQQQKRLEMAFDVFDVNDDQKVIYKMNKLCLIFRFTKQTCFKVDKKELLKLYEAIFEMRGLKAQNAKTKVDEIFTRYDRDRSGKLSKQEFIIA
jgi:Ca2+-binding EF-hand superfamily protein